MFIFGAALWFICKLSSFRCQCCVCVPNLPTVSSVIQGSDSVSRGYPLCVTFVYEWLSAEWLFLLPGVDLALRPQLSSLQRDRVSTVCIISLGIVEHLYTSFKVLKLHWSALDI